MSDFYLKFPIFIKLKDDIENEIAQQMMADITAEMAVQEAQIQETAELETTDLVLNDLCQNIFNNWGI